MISLLVPTRGRPSNIKRFAESVRETAETDNWEFVWAVDEDDMPSATAIAEFGSEQHRLLIGPRKPTPQLWNDCWHAARGDIYGMVNDDMIFRAQGWDRMIEQAFQTRGDRILLVFGPEGIHNGAVSTVQFLSKEWTDVLGYFMPEHFGHDFIDTWMNDCAVAIDRRLYVPELFLEHLHWCHPTAGVQRDRTYDENMERVAQGNDQERYYGELAPLREADIAKLRAALRG